MISRVLHNLNKNVMLKVIDSDDQSVSKVSRHSISSRLVPAAEDGWTHIVDHEMHYGLGHEVSDGLVYDADVRIHQITDGFHLPLQLRVHRECVCRGSLFIFRLTHTHTHTCKV